MRKVIFPLLVSAFALVACGTSVEGGGSSSSTSSSSSGSSGEGGSSGQGGAGGAPTAVAGAASVINDCAPNDGKAYTIKIGLADRSCTATPSGPFLRMSFYTHTDSPAGNTWDLANALAEAQGIYQPDPVDPSNLVVVKAGMLQVTTWDGLSATGSYDLLLVDGTHLGGTFDAIACLQEPALCG